MTCSNSLVLGYFYIFASIAWGSCFIWWIINTWKINWRFTKPLQKVIVLVLCFKTFNDIFLSPRYFTCQESAAYDYWDLAWSSTYTLYNTFIFTSLILISKGFGITRDMLERSEVTVIAMTMGAVYLGFSAFMINPQQLIILLDIMLSILFYLTWKYCSANIKALQTRLNSLRDSNITQMIPPTSEKVSMLKFFLKVCYFFYFQKILTITFLMIVASFLDPPEIYWDIVVIFGEVCETISLFIIIYLFRSKDRGLYFNISVVGSQAQTQPLAPYLQAKIPDGLELPERSDETVVVLCPQEFDREHPYKRLMLGTISKPVVQTFDIAR
ncbi:unnamed protein product [Blepharisma stoltei]|uniref:Uncharacterized protein n=1 Tax=Blepharisma stoltei TaxID=1481888 RepID=A0AAU9KH39_9CILI|nr:unnamed protein product [Blepharisma stoltei]